MQQRLVLFLWTLGVFAGGEAGAEPASRPVRKVLFERVSARFLEALDRDRAALEAKVRSIEVPYGFVRGTFHMHSKLSHDSQGTIKEIIKAAKATGTRIVGFTEHPRKDVDVIAANVKGWRDDVYFLAGVEKNNAIFWPGRQGEADLRFVSHVEEVSTFDRQRYAGMEIYNTHSDVKDEPTSKVVLAMVMNLRAVQAHPESAFCSFFDRPGDFLAWYDRLTAEGPFAGLAANDCHQNQALKLIADPNGSVRAVDAEAKTVWQGRGMAAVMLMAAYGQKGKPAEPVVLTEIQLDPYEISMRHVGTFLQIGKINEKNVRHGLRTGRIILGFELVAPLPAVGFWVERGGKAIGTVGDQIGWQKGLVLRAKLPLQAQVQVFRNGKPFGEASVADGFNKKDIPPGVYRLEAYQTLAGQRYPWVISNAVYVRNEE